MIKKIAIALLIVVLIIVLILGFQMKNNTVNNQRENVKNNLNNNLINNSQNIKDEEIVNNNNDINIDKENFEGETVITLLNDDINVEGNVVNVKNIDNIKILEITEGGAYRLKGTLDNGRIIVNNNQNVNLILDNVKITCLSNSPIFVYNSNSVKVTLEKNSENILSDGIVYSFNDEFSSSANEKYMACLYSEADLNITGNGKLVINANNRNGITSLGDLTLEDTNIIISSVEDGIKSFKNVSITDSILDITTGGGSSEHFVKKEDNRPEREISSKGINVESELLIEDAEINIDSYDDAIHSNDTVVLVRGSYMLKTNDDAIKSSNSIIIEEGTVDIPRANEGIESYDVNLYNSIINILAQDDCINLKSDDEMLNKKSRLNVDGGNITLNAIEGDCIDSNGSIEIMSGKFTLFGPNSNLNSAIDYVERCNINGGELIAFDTLGLVQEPSSSSAQVNIVIEVGEQKENTKVMLKDLDGNEIISAVSPKIFQKLIISSEKLVSGKKYKLYINDEEPVDVLAGRNNARINR